MRTGTAFRKKEASQAEKRSAIAPERQLEGARTAGGAEMDLFADGRSCFVTVKAAPGRYVTFHARTESQAWALLQALEGVTRIEA